MSFTTDLVKAALQGTLLGLLAYLAQQTLFIFASITVGIGSAVGAGFLVGLIWIAALLLALALWILINKLFEEELPGFPLNFRTYESPRPPPLVQKQILDLHKEIQDYPKPRQSLDTDKSSTEPTFGSTT